MRHRLIPLVLFAMTTSVALPVAAEVTQTIEGRFGVGYTSMPGAGAGRMQPLYEGRYTSTFTQRTDSGLTFRFELGVIVGNMPERGERHRPVGLPVTGAVSVGTD